MINTNMVSMHNRIKEELTGQKGEPTNKGRGSLIIEKIPYRWIEYVKGLFHDTRKKKPTLANTKKPEMLKDYDHHWKR